jgi:lipoprotein-releasing system permease protein
LGFAQRLFEQEGCASALEIKLAPNSSRKEIEAILGNDFRIQDRHEQQEDVFRIMQVEKLISYAFLCFILLVACLNIIGSLNMLIIEKRDNIKTFVAMGATSGQIQRIFMSEGLMIIFGGAAIGLFVGLVLCLLQQHFGFISMGQSEGSFIIDAYPVVVHATDLITILATVLLLGTTCVLLATRKKYF